MYIVHAEGEGEGVFLDPSPRGQEIRQICGQTELRGGGREWIKELNILWTSYMEAPLLIHLPSQYFASLTLLRRPSQYCRCENSQNCHKC